ncbi:pyrimidine 5'-nucleotidase [bacterium]|nr:pyrimidine 5'-nucleotidase [bacterium]
MATGTPRRPSAGLAFDHVETWVFDLDNTLYPAACDLFAAIDVRMTEFVAQELRVSRDAAFDLQKRYYAEYGTTLAGLMAVHGVAPEAFLDYVHEIDLAQLDHAPDLSLAIEALPGRKFVFTNGSRRHAERVTERLRLGHLFEDLFDIAAAGFAPKHQLASYERFVSRTKVDPRRSVMFEDLARNLAPAAALGFTTVLVRSTKDWSHEPATARPAGPGDEPDHVDHVTDDLQDFLGAVSAAKAGVGEAGDAS